MSKKPTRSAQSDDSIMKKDHLAALMKQQADMTKQQAALMKQQAAMAKKQAALAKMMEEMNENIKSLVMEESTSPLMSIKIEEEEVIDLTSSPNVKVEEDIATSDDTTIKLEDVEVENVSTHSTTVASNIATTPTRTNTTTPVTKGKRNKKSMKMSPTLLRQALTTIPNRLFSPLRRESTDSRHTPPKANSTLRDLDPIWLAAENNTIGDLMHPVVKAKLSSSQSESDNCIYHLKLYRRYDNQKTQLVMHNPASGHVKFTVMITSMYDLEYTIVRRKMMTEVGVISFISMVRAEVIEQFMLRVNRNAVYDLYRKLVELGASEKNTA
jgi:hypothetical protein